MMQRVLTIFGTLAAASALHPFHVQMNQRRIEEEAWWMNRYGVKSSKELGLGPAPEYFVQYQDHFDGANTKTWNQAYYVNATYWKPGSDAPIFLCVGGEGPPLDGSVVVASPHCNVAVEWLQETGALMFAVEHRYYGCHNLSACPVPEPALPGALKYLSSRQALGDLAQFHAYAVRRYNLTTRNKWVSFGGSYPGMLAGWFRLKFPHLVHASVASSAPVKAQVDMRGYNDVVASAFSVSDQGVGGSPACTANIANGHQTIGQMFNTTEGRQTLSQLFGHTPDWYESTSNQASFAGNGVASFPAQSNDPACTQPACNIGKICAIMTDASLGDNVQRLAHLRKTQMLWSQDKTLMAPDSVVNYWGYQTCTEFAFYQTCEVGSNCFYTQGYVTVASMEEFCQVEFGISSETVQRNVDYTNEYYGGDQPAGDCVLYPNGEVDPWHALSVLKSPSPGIPVMMVPGASHHAWTHPSLPTDQQSVVQARQQIRSYVTKFLNQTCEQSTL
eukprot:TRINITY_DN5628_c0_g1_i2.p1 TRINITY_DN5628_c0_g1~~TRINITY_DN5628_c0_g1_i2.p1  ORF type:complete len:502 (+),score=157.98 TRINITY_DN5628_c0_g1_i2:98-1603(+)